MTRWHGVMLLPAMSAACWSSTASDADRPDVARHDAVDDAGVDRTGEDDAADDSADIPSCEPPCPAGSECLDRDGVGAPECVRPSGELACVGDDFDHAYCPEDGTCEGDVCVRWCSCLEDSDCGVDEVICVNEDTGCGMCALRDAYSCLDASDCRYVVDLSLCCRCPKARNASTVAADPCLVAYPPVGVPPPGCEPDCTGIDHCWPCAPDGSGLECRGMACRVLPAP